MIWYFHLFKNVPQFVLIYTVKGFSIVNETEVDIFFWNSLAFSMIQQDVGNLISGSSAFSKSSLNVGSLMVHVLLKPGLGNFEHYFLSV